MAHGTRLSISDPPKEFVPEREGITLVSLSNPQCKKWFGMSYVSEWEDFKNLACATFGVTGEMVIYSAGEMIRPTVWQYVVHAGIEYGVAFYPYITGAIVIKNKPPAPGAQPAPMPQGIQSTPTAQGTRNVMADPVIQPAEYKYDFQVRTSTNADVGDLRRQTWYSMSSDPMSGPKSLRLATVSPWRLHGAPTAGPEFVMEDGHHVAEYLWGPVDRIVVEVTEL